MNIRAIILISLAMVFSVNALAEKRTIRIGVLAYRGVEQTRKLWKPTASYLSQALPRYKFVIVPLDHPRMRRALRRRQLDFVLTNTGHYVELEADYGITRIATLVNRHGKKPMTKFGAVIFTRANHPSIRSIKDVRGKTMIAVKKHAFGGFRMAWAELLNHGINPQMDLKKLEFSGFPVDRVAHAVKSGRFDVGTFRTGVLERMARQGKIKLSDFRILTEKYVRNFPLLLSTELYPEWPFSKTSSAPEELTERIAIALLRLENDSESANKANIAGWTVPLDYQKVHELYKRLRVGPYRNLGKVTLEDILRQYWHIVVMTSLLILFLTGVIVYVLKLDKKVRKSEYSLARAQEIAHIGNWEWNNVRNEMIWSDEVLNMFDMEQRPESISIEQFIEKVHIDDREFVKNSLNDALYYRKPFNIDHRIVTRDGTIRVVHQQAEVKYNETGKAIAMLGIIQDITERKSAEDRLRESEQELASILNNMQDTFFRINAYGRVVSISPSVTQLLGYEMPEVINSGYLRYLEKGQGVRSLIDAMKAGNGRVDNYEMHLRHKSGMQLITAVSAHFIYDQAGDLDGIEGIARNVSELVHTRDDLSREKERIQITLESIGDGVITTDISGVVVYMNAVAEKMTGWKLADARGLELFDVFNVTESHVGDSLQDGFDSVLSLNADDTSVIHDAVLRNKEEDRYFVEVTMASIRDHDSVVSGSVIVFHDVTEVREMARKMAYHAKHDGLTGLINRRELEVRLEAMLESVDQNTSHAFLYMDLDNFKEVNDVCGHLAGDELLKQLSDQFKARIRGSDTLSRIGGDEFCLLLPNCPLHQAKSIGESLLGIVKDFRFSWGERVFDIGLSIGLIEILDEDLTVMDVINQADIACYKAKEKGRNTLWVHKQDDVLVDMRHNEKLWIERIDKSIEEGRMLLYYQELVPMGNGNGDTRHYEILIRMKDEQGNIVLPMAFIPAAERFKLMSRIDRWVFEQTLELLSGLERSSMQCVCTVNISGQSVADAEFKEFVINRINESGVKPSSLCFELPESTAISNYADTSYFINDLHKIGCKFALDDFGNGISSFSYLKQLPVDYIKIDGTLIRDIVKTPVEYTIVSAINQIAHVLGKKTVAKCVENETIEKSVREIGVDFAQGYGLEKPVPTDEKSMFYKSA